MVNALNPAHRMAVKDEIITDLVSQENTPPRNTSEQGAALLWLIFADIF